jgi:para-nitrobenzyl esterase
MAQIPEADGLFAKMIIMSGVIPENHFDTECDPDELARKIMEYLRIEDESVEKLAKVPEPQFMWAVNKATRFFARRGQRVNWAPKPNDYYLCDPLSGDFTAHALTVPTMVGSVFSEFSPASETGDREALSKAKREAVVKKFYGKEGGKAILQAFRNVYPGMNEVYACEIDTMFLPATVQYVKKKAAEASAPVYNYLFTKIFDYDGGRAAWHCSDIPYFLHNGEMIPICHQKKGDYLDQVMSGAFVQFAKTGDPNSEGLPEWKPCAEGRMVTMVFDDECRSVENIQDELLPLVLKYRPPFHFEMSLPDDEEEEGASAWVF